jgi:glutathione S-transferase
MDRQLSVVGPAILASFWGLIRTPAEKRDMAAIAESQKKTTEAMVMLDAQLARTAYVAGDAFSMGDIPVGVMAYRFRELCPDRPDMRHLERWYASLQQRKAFKDHVEAIPLQ